MSDKNNHTHGKKDHQKEQTHLTDKSKRRGSGLKRDTHTPHNDK